MQNGALYRNSYAPGGNRLTDISGSAVQHDANGNLTTLYGGTLSYTPDNRLKEVVGLASYQYNGLGQRAIKYTKAPGTAGASGKQRAKLFFHGSDGQLLSELGPTGRITRDYYHLNGTLIAFQDYIPTSTEPFLKGDLDGDGTLSQQDLDEWTLNHYNPKDVSREVTGDGLMTSADLQKMQTCVQQRNCTASQYTARLHYVHTDHLGTPQMVTDHTGRPVWLAIYTPYGLANAIEDLDGDGQKVTLNVRFPGQYYDAESGLHYNYFRDYDPNTGRYIESDPIGLNGGLNPYTYVHNNPLSFIDPLGLYDVIYPPSAGALPDATTQTAMQCFADCLQRNISVTGAREGGHSPGSAHETGQACDVGKNSNPGLNRQDVQRCFLQCFDRPRSYGQEEGNHYHLQTRPGRGGATGFADGVR